MEEGDFYLEGKALQATEAKLRTNGPQTMSQCFFLLLSPKLRSHSVICYMFACRLLPAFRLCTLPCPL